MAKNVLVNPAEYRRLTRPVVTYGCAKCGAYHTEGDELFALHLHRQAKHHYSEAPATPADVLRRVRQGD